MFNQAGFQSEVNKHSSNLLDEPNLDADFTEKSGHHMTNSTGVALST